MELLGVTGTDGLNLLIAGNEYPGEDRAKNISYKEIF